MVKVQAPALSMAASGKLGGAIVFASWKGRPYVRELVRPSNPKSGPQIGVRAMMKFLSQQWAGLSTADKEDWLTRAAATTISNFNAYVAYNMSRWRSFLAPSKTDPATEASTALTVSSLVATGAIHQASVAITPSAGTAIWGYAIFSDQVGTIVPAFSNCIAVIEADGANAVTFIHSPLAAGEYYYKAKVINIDGKFGANSTEDSATVT